MANVVIRGDDWAEQLNQWLAPAGTGTVAWMEQHTALTKSDAYCRVGMLQLKQQLCFLKLYLAKSRWQQLGFRLGIGRGIRAFDAARELRREGLQVPAPRACLWVPEGVLLLTEGIADSRDLRALWLEQPAAEYAGQLMQCAGQALAALHRAGFAHGDCKWSNLLWNGEGCYLVDLEAVRKVGYTEGVASPTRKRQLRDLARFTVDAEELGAGQPQYDVFLESYCAVTHCDRRRVAAGIAPAVSAIRRRHYKKYGTTHRSLC